MMPFYCKYFIVFLYKDFLSSPQHRDQNQETNIGTILLSTPQVPVSPHVSFVSCGESSQVLVPHDLDS